MVDATYYTDNPNNVPEGLCAIYDNSTYSAVIGDFDRYFGISFKGYNGTNYYGLQIICLGKAHPSAAGSTRKLAFRLLWTTTETGWEAWHVIN